MVFDSPFIYFSYEVFYAPNLSWRVTSALVGMTPEKISVYADTTTTISSTPMGIFTFNSKIINKMCENFV